MENLNQITLTPKALTQLKKLCQANGEKGLHIEIKKTGCSGYSYDLAVIVKAKEDDVVFLQAEGYFVSVAKKNLPFVVGSEIDYVTEGLSSRFKFINPNEKAVCGCGESFVV